MTSTSAYFFSSASTILRCPPLTACIRLVSELRSYKTIIIKFVE